MEYHFTSQFRNFLAHKFTPFTRTIYVHKFYVRRNCTGVQFRARGLLECKVLLWNDMGFFSRIIDDLDTSCKQHLVL